MTLHVYYGEALTRYHFGAGHPFDKNRLQAFWKHCVALGLHKHFQTAAPILASNEMLARFHTQDYLERVQWQSQIGTGYLDHGDTPSFPGVYEAAAYVVGSTLAGISEAVSGTAPRCFIPIAGLHHARREAGAGFCVFNDLGVAIETLRKVHGIRRIAYVDIDAHHGDGVFYAYEDDPEVIIADIHEDGRFLYPGTGREDETGRGAAAGSKLNIPLAPGADDKVFQQAWPEVEAFVRAAKPEIILLQAGADCIAGDPLTHLAFTPAVHAHVTTRLRAIADEYCNGRMIVTGGGGYNHDNLAQAWTAVVKALLA